MKVLYTAYLKGCKASAELFQSDVRGEVLDFADKYRTNFGGNVFVTMTEVQIPSSWLETTQVE